MLTQKNRALGFFAAASIMLALFSTASAFGVSHSGIVEHLTSEESLKAFSVQCGTDLGNVYSNPTVANVNAKISSDLAGAQQTMQSECHTTIFQCATPFGDGYCCSVNGADIWKGHMDDIAALGAAGSAVTAGAVAGFSQVIKVNAGGTTISSSTAYVMPFYVPNSCRNLDDSRQINIQTSEGCIRSPSPSMVIYDCAMIW